VKGVGQPKIKEFLKERNVGLPIGDIRLHLLDDVVPETASCLPLHGKKSFEGCEICGKYQLNINRKSMLGYYW
jgi:hypothetical protein